jgi:hypothetical protein
VQSVDAAAHQKTVPHERLQVTLEEPPGLGQLLAEIGWVHENV